MSPARHLASWVGIAVALAPVIAHADDLVFLKNGGRIRGSVMSESPVDGVDVLLGDGRKRKLSPSEVDRVEYGDAGGGPAAAPTAAPPPPIAPPPAPAPRAPPAARPPPPLPPPPPPPPPPPQYGTLRVTSEEPATAFLDGKRIGRTPLLAKDEVTEGVHTVRVDLDAGGSDDQEVEIRSKATTVAAFSPSALRALWTGRRVAGFGLSLEALLAVPGGAPSPYGGGRLSMFGDFAVHPAVELRLGAFGGGAIGGQSAQLYPVGGFFSVVLHGAPFGVEIGATGGYAAGSEVLEWSTTKPSTYATHMAPLGFLGPRLGLAFRLGAERSWEIGVREDLCAVPSSGAAPISMMSLTTFGVTYVLFGRRNAATPTGSER